MFRRFLRHFLLLVIVLIQSLISHPVLDLKANAQADPINVGEIQPFLTIEPYNHIIVSPDQAYVATVFNRDTIRIISLITGLQTAEINTDIVVSTFPKLYWSPDGTKFATIDGDQFTVWNTDGEALFSGSHNDSISEMKWSSDSSTLYTNLNTGLRDPADTPDVGVWDVESGQLLHAFGSARNLTVFEINEANTILVIRGGQDRWQVWRLTNSPELAIEVSGGAFSGRLMFSDNPQYVYISGTIWDVLSGEPLVENAPEVYDGARILLEKDQIIHANFNRVETIDIVSGAITVNVEFGESVWGSIFAHDYSRVLTIGKENITIWDMATGHPLFVLRTPQRVSSVNWDSEQNIVTGVWSNEPAQPTEPSLIWRWNLSPEAVANGTFAILPDPDAVVVQEVPDAPSQTAPDDEVESTNSSVLCEISSSQSINKRTGPGTNYEIAGQLQPNQQIQAIGQTSVDGYLWWKLADNTWVRGDLVNSNGECVSLPQAE